MGVSKIVTIDGAVAVLISTIDAFKGHRVRTNPIVNVKTEDIQEIGLNDALTIKIIIRLIFITAVTEIVTVILIVDMIPSIRQAEAHVSVEGLGIFRVTLAVADYDDILAERKNRAIFELLIKRVEERQVLERHTVKVIEKVPQEVRIIDRSTNTRPVYILGKPTVQGLVTTLVHGIDVVAVVGDDMSVVREGL